MKLFTIQTAQYEQIIWSWNRSQYNSTIWRNTMIMKPFTIQAAQYDQILWSWNCSQYKHHNKSKYCFNEWSSIYIAHTLIHTRVHDHSTSQSYDTETTTHTCMQQNKPIHTTAQHNTHAHIHHILLANTLINPFPLYIVSSQASSNNSKVIFFFQFHSVFYSSHPLPYTSKGQNLDPGY